MYYISYYKDLIKQSKTFWPNDSSQSLLSLHLSQTRIQEQNDKELKVYGKLPLLAMIE